MIGRRAFLTGAAAAGAGVLAACSSAVRKSSRSALPAPGSSVPATAGTAATGTLAPTTSTSPAHSGPAAFVAHGPPGSRGVALTFHTAGDPAVTTSLLDQAAQLGARLTFFVVGTWAAANPDVVHRIVSDGHELGNHTWSHVNIQSLGLTAMRAEVQRCADVLHQETGSISRWFRPSQTDVPDATVLGVAGEVGYATSVGYDVDPLDYTNPGAALIEGRVRDAVHGGAIVSLHTLYQGTATAFAPVVRAIRAAGLEPVTTSAVLIA